MIGDEVIDAIRDRFPTARLATRVIGGLTPGGPVRQVLVELPTHEVFTSQPAGELSILPRMRQLPREEWRSRQSVYEYVPDNGYDILVPGRDDEDRPDTLDELLNLLAEVLS